MDTENPLYRHLLSVGKIEVYRQRTVREHLVKRVREFLFRHDIIKTFLILFIPFTVLGVCLGIVVYAVRVAIP